MARKLESFPAPFGTRYPWGEWLDGSDWELVRGDDYNSRTSSLRANAQIQAKKRGGRVRSKSAKVPDGREAIVIQFERE